MLQSFVLGTDLVSLLKSVRIFFMSRWGLSAAALDGWGLAVSGREVGLVLGSGCVYVFLGDC